MVPLTGQNTINDMVDRINEVSQEIQDVAFVNANAVMGPASSSADQIMAFSDTTGKKAKAANISSFAYSILDDADEAAARATLGLKSAAVLDAATAATANTAVQRDANGNITGVGITATSGFVGNGSQITSLNVGNVASGTLDVARGGTGATTATGTGSVVKSASPTFTGAPLSTTATPDTNTTQIATTAYVIGQASTTTPVMDGVAAVGTSLRYARADHVHPSDTTKVNTSLLGVANGVATLDSAGKVPTSQLPAYVDDVLEYTNLASFPATGETGKIYVALDTNKTYRWSGSAYIYITSGAVDSVAGKTGVVTLVKGDVGLGNVDNTSDVNKPVSTAQQNALNLKANLASPALTGTPTAPTAAVGTNTTQLATTAFVNAEIANDAPSKTGVGASGSWGISVTGNAATATKLETARTIALAGDVTGSASFDGSGNVSINAQVADDSHTHSLANLGLGNAATATVQTSPTDTTAGRLMTVGAFGLGSESPPVVNDPNLERQSGIKSGGGASATNLIGNTAYGPLLTLTRFSSVIFQMAAYGAVSSEPELRIRGSGNSGVDWGAWRQVYHSGNLLNIGTTAATARTALELGTAATKNVGTSSGDVVTAEAFGLKYAQKVTNFAERIDSGFYLSVGTSDGRPTGMVADGGWMLNLNWAFNGAGNRYNCAFYGNVQNNFIGFRRINQLGEPQDPVELYHTGNIGNANAGTATKLATARTIGGVSFDGTANINLPGVNTAGNQSTSGNAATATKLATGRTIGMTGDVTWTSPAFDGSGNVTAAATLANTGVTAGTYTKVTVNAKGLVTAGAALAAADIPALDTGKLTTGILPIARGGTGGDTQEAARTALGIGSMATRNVTISTDAPSGGADGDVWIQY